MGNKRIQFRDSGEGRIIEEVRDSFNFPSDSTAARMLIRQGKKKIDLFLEQLEDVTQVLKMSEIDYFTSSLNVILKRRKREKKKQIGGF